MSEDSGKTHFGYREVPVQEKPRLVGAVFDSVAERYDLMNDLMSLGIHRLWKRYFVALSGTRPGHRVLDLAGGTGDIARLLAPRVRPGGSVVVADVTASMLRRGRERLTDDGCVRGVRWAQTDAEHLPFPDASFDLVTIAFGLRNVTDQAGALAEMHRVLAPGGRLLVLEFSRVHLPGLAQLYDLYSFAVLPFLGRWVADDAASYRYLAESIRRHPDQRTLESMLTAAGFVRCRYYNLSGGIVAIHSGYKA